MPYVLMWDLRGSKDAGGRVVDPLMAAFEVMLQHTYGLQPVRREGDGAYAQCDTPETLLHAGLALQDEAERRKACIHLGAEMLVGLPTSSTYDDEMATLTAITKESRDNSFLVSETVHNHSRAVDTVAFRQCEYVVIGGGEVVVHLWSAHHANPSVRVLDAWMPVMKQLPKTDLPEERLARRCDSVLNEALRIAGGKQGSLILVDRDNGMLDIVSTAGDWTDSKRELVLGVGRGITGWVALTEESLNIDSISTWLKDGKITQCVVDPRLELWRPQSPEKPCYVDLHSDIHSELAVPVKHSGELIGVINLDGQQEMQYSKADQKAIELLAELVANSIVATRNERTKRAATEVVSFAKRALAPIPRAELLDACVDAVKKGFWATCVDILLWDDKLQGFQWVCPEGHEDKVYRKSSVGQLTANVGFGKEAEPSRTRCAYYQRKDHGGQQLEFAMAYQEGQAREEEQIHKQGKWEPWIGVPIPPFEDEHWGGVLRANRLGIPGAQEHYFRLFTDEEGSLLKDVAEILHEALRVREPRC